MGDTAAGTSAATSKRYAQGALIATSVSALVVNANTSAVSILIPAISDDTGTPTDTLQWAVTGYSLVGAGRFDLLSLPWKVASTCLAVLFPVASLGLWLTVSWGPVIWVLAAGGQILMYGLLPQIFGANRLIILLHVIVAVIYWIFRLSLWLERRRQRRQVSVDLP